MHIRHVLLVAAAVFASCNALWVPADAEQSTLQKEASRDVKGPQRLVPRRSDAISRGRGLWIDNEADGDYDHVEEAEERAGLLGLTEKLSSMKADMTQWAKNDDALDVVKVALGLDKVSDKAFTSAKNFDVYNVYVIEQIPVWSAKGLTPAEVLTKLGIAQLTGVALKGNYNYQYYQKFMAMKLSEWSKKELTPTEVLKLLGMEALPLTGLAKSPNYEFYGKYLAHQASAWAKRDLSPDEVKVLLGMDTLLPEASTTSLNRLVYQSFMADKLHSWEAQKLPPNEVKAQLGLTGLSKEAFKAHPNVQYFVQYVEMDGSILLKRWVKRRLPTPLVWAHLGLEKVSASSLQTSDKFILYTQYVNKIDDKGVRLQRKGGKLPTMLSTLGNTPAELSAKAEIWASANRSKDYVKYVLGLDKLEGTALTSHKNYRYYDEFLAARRVT